MRPHANERYAVQHGEYVLFSGDSQLLSTRVVAVLIDTRLGVLITHGDPASVRRELDAMRRIAMSWDSTHHEQDWLLLEGQPRVDRLNDALHDPRDLQAVTDAFAGDGSAAALRMTRALFARLARR